MVYLLPVGALLKVLDLANTNLSDNVSLRTVWLSHRYVFKTVPCEG